MFRRSNMPGCRRQQSRKRGSPGLSISSPAAGSLFPIGIPVTVTVNQSGNWDLLLDGTVRGTISSGTSGVAIADAADTGASVVLSVRTSGDSVDLYTSTVTVPAWTGTLSLGWDPTRGTTSVGGKASEIQQFVGGGAADYLVQATADNRPPLGASAKLNGRLSVSCSTAERMVSATPASATSISQAYTVVYVGVSVSAGVTAYASMWDGANAATRSNMRMFNDNFNIYNGSSGADTGISVDSTQGVLIAETANGASTSFRYLYADGTNETVNGLSPGADAIKGVTLFDYQAIGRPGVGAEMTMLTIFDSSYSSDDWDIWEAWVQTELGFSAPL